MLARISGGSAGIREYLERGQKQGREHTRDELDQRVPLRPARYLAAPCWPDRHPTPEAVQATADGILLCANPMRCCCILWSPSGPQRVHFEHAQNRQGGHLATA